MFSKTWKKADIKINWKNAPNSIKELYNGYVISPNQNISLSEFEGETVHCRWRSLFQSRHRFLEKEVWNTKAQDIELFKKSDGTYKTQFSLKIHDEAGTSGAIRLT
jgi:hypothetical protein